MFASLQMGIPGGVELLIILVIMLLLLGVPLLLVVGGVVLYRSRSGERASTEELEARIADLERELERERSNGGNDAERTDAGDDRRQND